MKAGKHSDDFSVNFSENLSKNFSLGSILFGVESEERKK